MRRHIELDCLNLKNIFLLCIEIHLQLFQSYFSLNQQHLYWRQGQVPHCHLISPWKHHSSGDLANLWEVLCGKPSGREAFPISWFVGFVWYCSSVSNLWYGIRLVLMLCLNVIDINDDFLVFLTTWMRNKCYWK